MPPRTTSPLRVATRSLFLLLVLLLSGWVGAEITVSNLKTSQRPDGSGLVDIRFDLATIDADTTQSFVTVAISPDGGRSWPIMSPTDFLSGELGANIAIGSARHVVWDAAADRPEVLWTSCRVRVSAMAQQFTVKLPGGVPLVLARIPAGTFDMGSPPDERGRYTDEGPQTTVTISRDFYLGKCEVTQAQWLAVMGSWPGTAPTARWGEGPDYPAYNISWDDAQEFIAALNTHLISTGQGPATMRLPTEAEWEFAARGGTSTRFSFGESLSVDDLCEDDGLRSKYMWYCGNNSPSGSKPVGQRWPNALGLHDMHANVWEWCQDAYASSLPGGDVTDPTGAPTGSTRLGRGGGWNNDARDCRSAFRGLGDTTSRSKDGGFRVAASQ